MDNDNIFNMNYFDILNKLFLFSKTEKKFCPILNKQFNSGIINLFEFLSNESNKNIENCLKILYNIFNISIDIAIIISTSTFFKEKKNYNFLTLLIDLYIKTEQKEIQEIINQIFSFLFKNITINKTICDYHLNKLLKEFKNQNLSFEKFLKYIKFLPILFGLNNKNEIKEPRNFFYFNNSPHSGIEIPFSSNINFFPINGFSFVIWFSIEQYENQNSSILEMITSDNQKICIFLNQSNELEIKVNLNIIKSLNIPIKKGIWNLIKFSFTNSKLKNPEIHFFLFENHNDKYTYYKKAKLNNIKFLENSQLTSIIFFQNFLGKFTSIILYSIENLLIENDNHSLNYKYGIYTKKQLIKFSDYNEKKDEYHPPITFMLTPISFDFNNYILIDPMSKIKGKFCINEDENIKFNYVKIYKKSFNNIYNQGGMNIFLFLVEMIYKKFQNEECFKEVIYFIWNIINYNNKNLIDAINCSFFRILSLYLENIDDSLFNLYIIEKFIQIEKKMINLNIDSNEIIDYSNRILFNLNLLKKYSNQLLCQFWALIFKDIEILIDYFPNLTKFSPFLINYCLKYSFDKNLFEILKTIICEKKTNDIDRCNFFKLLSFEDISIELRINIIELFYFYFNSEFESIQRNTLSYFLKNNCINEVIYTLSNENLTVKLKIIELISIVINNYYIEIKDFSRFVETNNSKYKVLEKKEIINLFKYNIIINEINEKNKTLKIPSNVTNKNFHTERRGSAFFDLSKKRFDLFKTSETNSCFPESEITKKNSYKNTAKQLSYNNLTKLETPNKKNTFEKNSTDSSFNSNNESFKSSSSKSLNFNYFDDINLLLAKNKENNITYEFNLEKNKNILYNNNKKAKTIKLKSKSSISLRKNILVNKNKITENNSFKSRLKKTKSQIINFNYSSLSIDIDKRNQEPKLEQHCVDHIDIVDSKDAYNKKKFDINYNNNNTIISPIKNLKKEIEIIEEDENEICVKLNKDIDLKINYNYDDKNLTPQNLNLFELIIEDNNIDDDNLKISSFLCQWFLLIIKIWRNKIVLHHEFHIHNIILDCIILQCKKFKNVKYILNILSFLSLNKEEKNDIKDEFIWKKCTQLYLEHNKFFNFLVDIMFTSYLVINVNDNEENIKEKKRNFIECYNLCKNLYLEIYFNNLNENTNVNNNMVSFLFPYLLNFQNNHKYNKGENNNQYIYEFLRDIITGIINKYNKILKNTYPILYSLKLGKIKNQKIIYWTNFIQFISLFYEFTMLFQNAKRIYDTKSKFLDKKNNNYNISKLPLYILNGGFLSKKSEECLWADFNNFKNIFDLIKCIWSRERIFKICGIIKNNVNKNNIYILSMDEINQIISYFIEKKDNLEKLEPSLDILFSSFNITLNDKDNQNKEYYLPLINTISIQIVYFINLINDNIDEIDNLKLWLNEYQFYVIFILFCSCYYKEKKNSLDKNDNNTTPYLFYNLAFHIGNIFNSYYEKKNNEIKEMYHIIIKNISRIFSKIINLSETNNSSFFNLFKSKIEINENSAIILLNQHYITRKNIKFSSVKENIPKLSLNNKNNNKEETKKIDKLNTIFNKSDYNSDDYMNNTFLEENKEIIQQTLIYNELILKHSKQLFNIQMYQYIYHNRFLAKNKIKSIFNNDNYFKYPSFYGLNYRLIFENILIDNSNLKINEYEKIEYNNFIERLFIKKNLRRIKKELFSWNNTYSDFDTFYLNYKEKLKYKSLYHLTKDLTPPILIPILDFDYNMPSFSQYDKTNIFDLNYRDYYKIDLKIFPKEHINFSNDNNNNYYFECCYIKQTHHIKGKITINENIKFIPLIINDDKNYFKDDEEYQDEKNNCYGSIFKTNNNYKDYEFIRKISINNILLIFKRTYFYRDNSVEIFTIHHKSFYFKFKNEIIRDLFLQEITKNLQFLQIKTIDKKILGYYKNIEKFKDNFSNFDNLSKIWKNWKMSNLEYLMYLNIFGNRSYRDLHQYPIMPWILTNYLKETNEFDNYLIDNKENNNLLIEKIYDLNSYLITNYKRDFDSPIGLLKISNNSINRGELYYETFKTMIIDLINEDIIKMNLNENQDLNLKTIENQLDIESLYKNINLDYNRIPYLFGSHFSNATYISHYLVRIFPYCFTSIEIQGNNFDAADRLFFNLGNSFLNVSSEKCDVRELIPEFFCLPEMFENLNKLNLGYLQNLDDENINDTKFDKEKLKVENVDLPKWSNNNKNIFIIKMREILENEKLDINNWVDLIFGINQRGKGALKKGNLFYSYCYDGVISSRLDSLKKLNNKTDLNCALNLFELGVNPLKVLKDKKKRIEKQKIKRNQQILKYKCDLLNDGQNKQYTKNPVFISSYSDKNNNEIENLLILQNDFEKIKVIFYENKNNYCDSKSFSKIFNESNKKYLYKKLLISSFKNNSYFIITGFLNGNINLVIKKEKKKEIEIRINDPLISKRDKSPISCIEIDKDEEFIYAGTEKGSIIIYQIIDPQIAFFSMKKNHFDKINYINSNIRLNMFIDCSLDGFIHLYIMPKVQLIRSIYYFNNSNIDFIDYAFLSSSPLPSFILHNNKNEIISYSINGDKLIVINDYIKEDKSFIVSPFVFNGNDFMDYLIYGNENNNLYIRKFPLMNLIRIIKLEQNEIINSSLYFEKIKYKPVKFIQISKNKLFIYAIFDYSNNINVIPLNIE